MTAVLTYLPRCLLAFFKGWTSPMIFWFNKLDNKHTLVGQTYLCIKASVKHPIVNEPSTVWLKLRSYTQLLVMTMVWGLLLRESALLVRKVGYTMALVTPPFYQTLPRGRRHTHPRHRMPLGSPHTRTDFFIPCTTDLHHLRTTTNFSQRMKAFLPKNVKNKWKSLGFLHYSF